jgi:hypothetical protein
MRLRSCCLCAMPPLSQATDRCRVFWEGSSRGDGPPNVSARALQWRIHQHLVTHEHPHVRREETACIRELSHCQQHVHGLWTLDQRGW